MKRDKYTYFLPWPKRSPRSLWSAWSSRLSVPLLLLLLLLTAGCRKTEDPIPSKSKTLRFNIGGDGQAESGSIREIEVFVYDDKDRLIGRIGSTADGAVVLDYPDIPTLRCVAWGNSKDSGLELSPLQPGDPLDKGYLALKPLSPTRAGTGLYPPPPNLFRGTLEIDNNTATGNDAEARMPMLSTVATTYITIGGLQEHTGTATGEYAVVIRGAADRILFSGDYGKESSVHRITGAFNAEKEYVLPPFLLFPPAVGTGGITIDILHDGEPLRSVSQTSDGKPIVPVAGKRLELRIVFKPQDGGVNVTPPGWTSVDIEVSYDGPAGGGNNHEK